MESLRMMEWGLMLVENSSAAVAAVAVAAVAAVALRVGGYPRSHGCSRLGLLYEATTTVQG